MSLYFGAKETLDQIVLVAVIRMSQSISRRRGYPGRVLTPLGLPSWYKPGCLCNLLSIEKTSSPFQFAEILGGPTDASKPKITPALVLHS
jgi:hypothetical protein